MEGGEAWRDRQRPDWPTDPLPQRPAILGGRYRQIGLGQGQGGTRAGPRRESRKTSPEIPAGVWWGGPDSRQCRRPRRRVTSGYGRMPDKVKDASQTSSLVTNGESEGRGAGLRDPEGPQR